MVSINRQQSTKQFFESLIQKTNCKTNLFSKIHPSGKDQFINAGMGKTGIALYFHILKVKARVQFSILIPNDPTNNKAIFDALYKQKTEIEKEVGTTLDWDRNNKSTGANINKWFDKGLDNQDMWPELQQEMADTMVTFERVFRPRLINIFP